MTNVMKKLSAALLTLALVLTMMPMLALPAAADDGAAFGFAINGKPVSTVVTVQDLKDNAVGPQIFPFASNQGGAWTYVVADGASYSFVMEMLLGINSGEKLNGAAFRFMNADGGEEGKFDLSASDMEAAKDVFKLVDQDGKDITGPFKGDEIVSAEAKALEGAAPVTPIIAYKSHEYNSYEEAKAALDNGSWENGAKEDVRPYVGGNLGRDTFLKKDGTVNMKSVNFTGKFSTVVKDPKYRLNVKNYTINLPAQPESATVDVDLGIVGAYMNSDTFSAAELEYFGAKWESDNTAVAEIDADTGLLTTKSVGTTNVKSVVADGESKGTVIVDLKVNVNKPAPEPTPAPVVKAPAKPGSFKVKNVKKKTAQLSWKKSTGATKYEIYRSKKKNKGFKKIATTKKTSYKNKKLKKGKTYYFKVRAVNAGGKSKYTSVKKVKIKK